MKDRLSYLMVMVAALSWVIPGCGGDDTSSTDLGPERDMEVSADLGVDLDVDPDLGAPGCEGPPGLYVAGSCTELAAGVRPYRPQFELWSDDAEKERFVFIPEDGVINTSDPDRWVYPEGTIFWKTFSRDGVRLETRILTKMFAGEGSDVWSFQTFGWNQGQDAVTLVDDDGLENVLGTTHDIPSRRNCLECHAAQNRDVGLGFDAIQLADASLPLTLDDLAAAGEMSNVISMASAAVPGTEVQRSALGYLHANCSNCHGGSSPSGQGLNMRLRVGLARVCDTNTYVTALGASVDKAGTCQTPGRMSSWMSAFMRVAPNSIGTSSVYQLMNQRDRDQMPPVGTEDTDTVGLMIIENWIMGGVPDLYEP